MPDQHIKMSTSGAMIVSPMSDAGNTKAKERAIIEFTLPQAGTFLPVDHDHPGYLPTGFVMPFAVE